MRPKGAKGGSHLALKARWVDLSHFLSPIPWTQNWPKKPMDTILAINPVGPFFGHGPPWTNIPAMASGNHQRSPDQLSQPSPQLNGYSFHSFMPSVLEVAGVVHIWYYIPLCTIFAQQSNGDILRTHFNPSISRSQNPTPISKEDYSTHQLDKLWWQSEDSSRIPTTCICRSSVGTLFRIIQRGNSQEVLHQFSPLSRHQVFQYSLDNSMNPYRPHSINRYGLGPIGPFHIPLCEFHHTVQFQDGQNCIGPIQTIQPVIHLPGSVLQFFTYTGHLSSPADFFPS
ncbi:hypothetical protein O181_065051 [Austropuccinia psidii MF-1]|uniref:Uncharacterized protein n=1 Tax=Austropuccinia psidii MF-1 TaxID=1389203 RepID=A0A9Q3EUX4_9BASI|nr:hypothetical protein [Austropuccinia psidii MF-1]